MRSGPPLFSALFLLVLPAIGAAQTSAGPLTWQDCVAIAARNNPDLTSSARSLAAGQANYYGSFNGLMPNLLLSNSFSDSNSATAATNKWSASGSLSIDLFNASSIAGIKSASAFLSVAQANLRQASANLRFSLRQAFAQVIFTQKNLEVSRNINEMRDKDAQLVTLRYNSGRESKGNMLRAKAQFVQSKADLAQALRAVRTAQKSLDRQLGLDDFSVVTVTGTLEAAAPPDSPGGEPSWLARRPDVSVQEAAVRVARAAANSAGSSVWPSLSADYTRSRLGRTEFPNRTYGWTGGLTLSYALFGGGPTATYYAVKAADKNIEKAEQDLRTARDAAILDLENAWSGYASAVDQVVVQRALLDAARQRNDEADVRYASGLLTYDNWEIIASDRISTEKQAISAEFNAAVAQAAWEKSIGKELGE